MLIRFHRSLQPQPPAPLQILHQHTVSLNSSGEAVIDGQSVHAQIGCWMFYLARLQAKLFHAREGATDCTHAPDLQTIDNLDQPVGNYIAKDWLNALQTPIERRLAEIFLVSARLWRSGLGPQPLGVCFVQQFNRDGTELGPTCGLLTQNVLSLPRKLNCKLEQIVEAGVIPDQILSCVRQQLRGYVIDLCSVKGCRPADADAEVEKLERLFRSDASDKERLLELNQALFW